MGDVAESLRKFGDRYTRRVYSAGEQADVEGGDPRVRAERLAARFAVKEAVIKALAPGDTVPGWTDIEARTGLRGEPVVVLHGDAERLAAAAGIDHWAVSTAHEAGMAVAVVVATSPTGAKTDPGPLRPRGALHRTPKGPRPRG